MEQSDVISLTGTRDPHLMPALQRVRSQLRARKELALDEAHLGMLAEIMAPPSPTDGTEHVETVADVEARYGYVDDMMQYLADALRNARSVRDQQSAMIMILRNAYQKHVFEGVKIECYYGVCEALDMLASQYHVVAKRASPEHVTTSAPMIFTPFREYEHLLHLSDLALAAMVVAHQMRQGVPRHNSTRELYELAVERYCKRTTSNPETLNDEQLAQVDEEVLDIYDELTEPYAAFLPFESRPPEFMYFIMDALSKTPQARDLIKQHGSFADHVTPPIAANDNPKSDRAPSEKPDKEPYHELTKDDYLDRLPDKLLWQLGDPGSIYLIKQQLSPLFMKYCDAEEDVAQFAEAFQKYTHAYLERGRG